MLSKTIFIIISNAKIAAGSFGNKAKSGVRYDFLTGEIE